MKSLTVRKLQSRRGVNVLILILLVLVIALAVVITIPAIRSYELRGEGLACSVALKKAQDMLDAQYMGKGTLTYDEAIAVVERSKWDMDALCPAGGDYYVVEEPDRQQKYRVTCGLHESDTRLRTRLNASRAYALLEENLEERARRGLEPTAADLEFTLNGKTVTVKRLEEDNGLRWGTGSSIDYEGTACFYSLTEEGEISWFVYADINHAAVWTLSGGWSGDSYA